METKIMKNQRGFTLVEIIAVLIILGILAAVATPKFFDMQVEAEKKALQGAVAELNAQAKLSWAKNKLEGLKDDALYTGYAVVPAGVDQKHVLGEDFEVTGQTPDTTPADVTIKLSTGNDTYDITFIPMGDVNQSPGYFKMTAQ